VKVLILHQFYNTPATGGALRSYYLAKALGDRGVDTVVLTTHNLPEILKTTDGKVEVHYLPVTYNNRYGFFKRVYSFLGFVWSIVRYAGHFRDAHVCYAISTPLTTGLAAMWIKLRYKIPFYFEVGDLWPEAPIQLGFVKNPILKFILYRLEKCIYTRSVAVVALSPPILEAIRRKVPDKPLHLIPNMADTEFFKPAEKLEVYEQKYGVNQKFVVSYIGTLGLANGLEYLLQCAEQSAKANLPVHFLVCGDGARRGDLIREAEQKFLKNISFIPFQNQQGVLEVMNISDAIMVCFKPLPVLETGSPNKFFDGLAAGKLIILNFAGWLKEEIQHHACGISVDPHHPADFVQQIKPFVDDRVLLQTYQAHARQLAEKKYARKNLTDSFVHLFIKQ
jgi:glycosyltransferase involved in cell wall biosynthesis